jgi:hypothetical protein
MSAPGSRRRGHSEDHTGDSHRLLPQLLAELADAGQAVDFVLVDGDHSSAGVRRDLEDLLASPAIRSTLILVHDASNPGVRAGLEALDYGSHDKLGWVELDWVEGFVFCAGPHRGQRWGGLGLLLADARRPAGAGGVVVASAPVRGPAGGGSEDALGSAGAGSQER